MRSAKRFDVSYCDLLYDTQHTVSAGMKSTDGMATMDVDLDMEMAMDMYIYSISYPYIPITVHSIHIHIYGCIVYIDMERILHQIIDALLG